MKERGNLALFLIFILVPFAFAASVPFFDACLGPYGYTDEVFIGDCGSPTNVADIVLLNGDIGDAAQRFTCSGNVLTHYVES
jgi:hypothetical protein